MPVTAKLSRNFYDRLGDEIASELVDWFNAVDSDSHKQLRELNDLNWERFKADVHSAIAQSEARLRVEIAGCDTGLRGAFSGLRGEFSELRAELIKWMFLFWVGTLVPLAGLIVALHSR